MKILKLIIGLLFIYNTVNWETNNIECNNSTYILNQVKKRYDPHNRWHRTEIKLHIEEPRVGNPTRHTKVHLINSSDYFEMERFREDGIVKRILTGDGASKIFLNNESDLPQNIIEQFKLNKQRSINHKKFYKLMYGLPMSLTDDLFANTNPPKKDTFEGIEIYRIDLELKDKIISNHLTLLIETKSYKLLAIEFNHPEEPNRTGEILKLESEFETNGIKLPRIRNWYIKESNEYLGTDIIITELQ